MVSLDGPTAIGKGALRASDPWALDGLLRHTGRRALAATGASSAEIPAAAARLRTMPAAPDWLTFLGEQIQPGAFAFGAVAEVLARSAAACDIAVLRSLAELQAVMLHRLAQELVLYATDLEARVGPTPIETAAERYRCSEPWAPTRALLGDLRESGDWAEQLLVCNLCVEPLVGRLLRGELGVTAAGLHGDDSTPVVARAALAGWEWTRTWTIDLVSILLSDPVHGDVNHEGLGRWMDSWLPRALEAAYAAAALAREMPRSGDTDAALGRVLREHRLMLDIAGLDLTP